MTGRLSQWLRPVAAVAGVVAVAAVLVLVNGHDGSDRSLSPRIPPTCQTNQADSAGERNALASRALKRQDAALRLGSQAGYLATWDSRAQGARWHAEHIYANLRALRITELDPRYDGAGSGLSLVAQQRLGTDAWKAEVDVSYALAASDPRRAETTVSFTFVRRGEVALVVAIEPAESKRTPIWLLPRLNVARSARTLVAATTAAEARRVGRHLRQAVEDVEKVLPSWAGKLVAYVPGNSVQLEALLAASPGSYDGIAAVTTTVDGSERQDAPVVIVVNPAVLDDLGPIGSHVVVTHESTHVATNAAVVKMPLWVAEG
ncbi:MAG: hypothetical protein H0T17_04195, partial [Propionibacteriales bacterium]|nr:hypothetical protein [Propionibacteriales bacterium]